MNKKIWMTGLVLAAVFAVSAGAMFSGVYEASAAEPEEQWEITENADTPLVDKAEAVGSANDEEKMTARYVCDADGNIEQISLDERRGLKLVSLKSGRDAEGAGFDFAGEQRGEFKTDFRIISKHSTIGDTNTYGPIISQDFDEVVGGTNPYADVIRIVFTFVDLETGASFELHIVGGGHYQITTPRAYVTVSGMEGRRSRKIDDNTGEFTVISTENKEPDYPANIKQTAFSNCCTYYRMTGNSAKEVKSNVIGFDPGTMEIYAMSRGAWNSDEIMRTVILDLDNPSDMDGNESIFTDTFKGAYKVQFEVAAMADNAKEVQLTGKAPEAYDRYATMMIYSVNGETPSKSSITAKKDAFLLSMEGELAAGTADNEYTLLIPVGKFMGETVEFNGEISVKDPDGNEVEVSAGKFTPAKAGVYVVTYSMDYEDQHRKLSRKIVVYDSAGLFDLDGWIASENAFSPLVDKVEPVGNENNVQKMTGRYVCNADGSIKQTSIDSRVGVKLVSLRSGRDAEGTGFNFAGEQSGEFRVDFRIFSAHSEIGDTNADGGEAQDILDAVSVCNPYTDVVRVIFTFTDSDTGDTFDLNILGGGKYSNGVPRAYITFPGMEGYRSAFYVDGAFKYICTARHEPFYPSKIYGSSFSNTETGWRVCGNLGQVMPVIIGFDPATMEVYADIGPYNIDKEKGRQVILDLDDPGHMQGYEENFDGLFRGGYTVSFRIENMTDNATEALLCGETPETYDRYATIMVYSVNGTQPTKESFEKLPKLIMSGSNTAKADLMHENELPLPVVRYSGSEISFAGEINLTDPDGLPSDITEGKFRPEKEGCYTAVYTMTYEGETAKPFTIKIYVSDVDAPVVSFGEGIELDMVYDAGESVRVVPSAEDLVIEDKESGGEGITVEIMVYDEDDNEIPSGEITGTGVYRISYVVGDRAGNRIKIDRYVTIKDTVKPVITLAGELPASAKIGEEIVIPEASAHDNLDGDIEVKRQVRFNGADLAVTGNSFIPTESGELEIIWKAADRSRNNADPIRKVVTVTEGDSEPAGDESGKEKKSGCGGSVGAELLPGIIALLGACRMMFGKRRNG